MRLPIIDDKEEVKSTEIVPLNEDKVIEFEENKKVAFDGKELLVKIAAATLAGIIIIVACRSCSKTVKKVSDSDLFSTSEDSVSSDEIEQEEETTEEVSENTIKVKSYGKTVDYSGAESFYSNIMNIRANNQDFATSFQSEEDVKNFVDFIYQFDPMYSEGLNSSIKSQEEFDEIVSEYYRDCVKYNVNAEMNLLFKDGSLAKDKLSEAESLANNLRNGTGSDYSISLAYYKWFLVNLVDGRTAISQKTKNAPLIDLLREQFEQYRYVGNMVAARANSKNDAMGVDKIDVPYGYNDEEDAIVYYDYLTCPDGGVDNTVSKSEEAVKNEGISTFENVNRAFDDVLKKRSR